MRYGVLLAYAPRRGARGREPGGATGDWESMRLWQTTSDSVQSQECNRGLGLLGNAGHTGDTKDVD